MRLTYSRYDAEKGYQKRVRSSIVGVIAAVLLAPGIVAALGNLFDEEKNISTKPVVTEIVDSAVKGISSTATPPAQSPSENDTTAGGEPSVNNRQNSTSFSQVSGSTSRSASAPSAGGQSTGGRGGDPGTQTPGTGFVPTPTPAPTPTTTLPGVTEPDPVVPPLENPPLPQVDTTPVTDTLNLVGGGIVLPILLDRVFRKRRV